MERYYANNCILGGKSQPARNTCPSVHISLHKAMEGKNIEHSISWEMQKYSMLRNRTGNICGTELMTTRHSPAGPSNPQSHICILLQQFLGVEPVKAHPVFHMPPLRFPVSCLLCHWVWAAWLFKQMDLEHSYRYSQAWIWGVKGWCSPPVFNSCARYFKG